MKVIHKYKFLDRLFVALPKGSEILSAQLQNGFICVWVKQPLIDDVQDFEIRAIPTGYQFDDTGFKFINTVQIGQLVWHVFYKEMV